MGNIRKLIVDAQSEWIDFREITHEHVLAGKVIARCNADGKEVKVEFKNGRYEDDIHSYPLLKTLLRRPGFKHYLCD
jgi:hypothetical protein